MKSQRRAPVDPFKNERRNQKACMNRGMQILAFIFMATAINYVALSVLPGTGLQAQQESGTPAAAPASDPKKEVRTRVIYREKSYYEFEDTLIRGDREGPGGLNVFRKDRVKFKSQLNLGRSFMPELKASADDAQ
jgi:hypothetical protein